LAKKAVLVIVPSGTAAFARPIETIAKELWRLGRVREREAYDFALPFGPLAAGAFDRIPIPANGVLRAAFLRIWRPRREAFRVDVAARTPQARLRRRLGQAP